MTRTRKPVTAKMVNQMTPDRGELRVAALSLVGSFIVLLIAMVFHPSGTDPNDHLATFTQYARAGGWTADHVLQFVGEAAGVLGLVFLFVGLNLERGMPRTLVRVGLVTSGVALALVAVRLSVDGVVLKRAVDAWASSPDAEKAARFATAESVRWLEEALTSFQGFVLGATLILLAALITWRSPLPWPISLLFALGGIGYVVAGWIVGVSGFAAARMLPSYFAVFAPPTAGVWLWIATAKMPATRVEAGR